MKQRIYFLIPLILGLFLFQDQGFSEGSKEIYIGTNNTKLFMCTDNVGHCNNGGIRTPFATFGCTETDRLYFSTLTNQETVFLGFNGSIDPATGAVLNHIVFQIKDMSGTVVYNEMNLPTSGTGFIPSINEARIGPIQVNGAGGYTAIDFHPSTPGTFYIEFAMRNNSTNNFFASGIDMNLIDITVQDTVANLVKPGRLYSKAWQLYENLTNYSATTYIYSVDSIITSCRATTMKGGIWVQFCNQWGCQNTGNFANDRKSMNSQSLLPQYKIFVNDPDIVLYPPATTLGQVVAPLPYGVPDCNTGHIDYHINVDKPGAVEIDLTFGGPYVTRILAQQVVVGDNLLTWDGLDGTLPVGIPVPNGITINFTVKYINGLTNLPFYDIEGNPNGFIISLVNPPGAQPLVFWDDSDLTGGGWSTNLTGCLSPPGCHTWINPAGDNKTVNTWWYNVSASTVPVNIVQYRKAGTQVFVQTPPTFCAGTTTHMFSVNTEPNTEQYHWSYTGAGATITQVSPTDNFVTVDFANNATSGLLQVYGTNSNCVAAGPTTSLAVTINPLPVVDPPTPSTVCAGVAANINLTSVPASTDFSWISPAPTCTPNIVSCPPGLANSNVISDLLNLTNSSPGSVTYHITSTLNGCTSTPQDFILSVVPSPVPIITGSNSVCAGTTGVVYQTQAGMTGYSWTITGGGTITNGIGTDAITVTWTTPGPQTVSVGYTGSCPTLIPTNYPVIVNALPVPSIGGPVAVCAGSGGHVYTTLPGMTNYLWNVSAGGTVTGGSGTDAITVTWNTAGPQTVSLNYTNLNGCTAVAPVVYNVTVNSLPAPSVTGPASVCLNSTATYFTEAAMGNYSWTVSAGGNITAGFNTNSIDVNWTTTGAKTITINYIDANGCTAAASTVYNVTVNNLPTPSLNGLAVICIGNSTTYTSDAGMVNYLWTVSAGGTKTGGGTVNDDFVTVTWNTAGPQTVTVNYSMATGCTAASPHVLNVTVNPRPQVTNAAPSAICSGITTNIPLFASLPLTTFTWTSTPSSGNVTGQSNSGGTTISQTLVNSGFNVETVDYAVTPSLAGCDGTVAHFIVTVNPVADVYFNPNGQTLCSGSSTGISVLSHVAGALLPWIAVASSPLVSGYSNGAGSSITQPLTSTATSPETVTYTVSPSFTGCAGIPNSVIVTVDPLPATSYTVCNDAITTTAAQPFKLKGGLPPGGTYTGVGVNSITGIFTPATAGPGNHIITYTSSNTWGCSAIATQTISVVNPAAFICDNSITDIRDNKQYPTVKIGAQCWMATNLNYGSYIVSSLQMQRDNCIPEKFCYGENQANCTSYGGLYQWDEIMRYDINAAGQGLCLPGWHVPTENDWTALFNFYTSNGFAGSPLKYTGYSGFNAFLSGALFNNENWNFTAFAVMFWSSTTEGTGKAWAHGMNSFNPSVSYYPSSKTNAFSVRCIHD